MTEFQVGTVNWTVKSENLKKNHITLNEQTLHPETYKILLSKITVNKVRNLTIKREKLKLSCSFMTETDQSNCNSNFVILFCSTLVLEIVMVL